MTKLIKNAAECPQCHDVIESTHRHDFKSCRCGGISVDGGLEYVRRLFRDELPIDRCEYREIPEVKSLIKGYIEKDTWNF